MAELHASQVGEYLAISLPLLAAGEHLSLEDVLVMADVLEISAAQLAALNRSDAEALTLMRVGGCSGLVTGEASQASGRDFHQVVASATGNPLLIMMSEPVRKMARIGTPEVLESTGVSQELARQHQVIAEAIMVQKPEVAAEAMAVHRRTLKSMRVH